MIASETTIHRRPIQNVCLDILKVKHHYMSGLFFCHFPSFYFYIFLSEIEYL